MPTKDKLKITQAALDVLAVVEGAGTQGMLVAEVAAKLCISKSRVQDRTKRLLLASLIQWRADPIGKNVNRRRWFDVDVVPAKKSGLTDIGYHVTGMTDVRGRPIAPRAGEKWRGSKASKAPFVGKVKITTCPAPKPWKAPPKSESWGAGFSAMKMGSFPLPAFSCSAKGK